MPAAWNATEAAALIDRESQCLGPLLPVLHALQRHFGCVPPQAIPLIAQRLRLTAADVDGVISFYQDFRRAPAPAPMIALCRGEACQAQGGRALEAALAARLTPSQATVEAAYCLGTCMFGPTARVDGVLVARATVESISAQLPCSADAVATAEAAA